VAESLGVFSLSTNLVDNSVEEVGNDERGIGQNGLNVILIKI
jgi:hypothetical protein